MGTPATHGRADDRVWASAVYTPAGQPVDFDHLVDRHRHPALRACIHQRRFHPTLIRSIDEIELHAPAVPVHRTAWQARCRSCGAPIPHPPLCTRCRTCF